MIVDGIDFLGKSIHIQLFLHVVNFETFLAKAFYYQIPYLLDVLFLLASSLRLFLLYRHSFFILI